MMIQNQNQNQVDWIEQLFFSDKACDLLRDLEDSLDKDKYNTEEELKEIKEATDPIDLMNAIGKHCSTHQLLGFKAGYIIAMSLARQSF